MYEPKLAKDIRCPLEYALDLFGGKWKSRIICVLAERGVLRYGELKNEMHDITDTILSSTLKALMKDALVERQQFEEIPPRVEYRLTAKGESVVPILQNICVWAERYYRDDESTRKLSHCQKCDYKGGCGRK